MNKNYTNLYNLSKSPDKFNYLSEKRPPSATTSINNLVPINRFLNLQKETNRRQKIIESAKQKHAKKEELHRKRVLAARKAHMIMQTNKYLRGPLSETSRNCRDKLISNKNDKEKEMESKSKLFDESSSDYLNKDDFLESATNLRIDRSSRFVPQELTVFASSLTKNKLYSSSSSIFPIPCPPTFKKLKTVTPTESDEQKLKKINSRPRSAFSRFNFSANNPSDLNKKPIIETPKQHRQKINQAMIELNQQIDRFVKNSSLNFSHLEVARQNNLAKNQEAIKENKKVKTSTEKPRTTLQREYRRAKQQSDPATKKLNISNTSLDLNRTNEIYNSVDSIISSELSEAEENQKSDSSNYENTGNPKAQKPTNEEEPDFRYQINNDFHCSWNSSPDLMQRYKNFMAIGESKIGENHYHTNDSKNEFQKSPKSILRCSSALKHTSTLPNSTIKREERAQSAKNSREFSKKSRHIQWNSKLNFDDGSVGNMPKTPGFQNIVIYRQGSDEQIRKNKRPKPLKPNPSNQTVPKKLSTKPLTKISPNSSPQNQRKQYSSLQKVSKDKMTNNLRYLAFRSSGDYLDTKSKSLPIFLTKSSRESIKVNDVVNDTNRFIRSKTFTNFQHRSLGHEYLRDELRNLRNVEGNLRP